MIQRKILSLGIAALWLGAGAVLAQDIPERVQQKLAKDGYEVISVGRTWLGRTLITASDGENSRTVVVARGSGQVLHDRVRSGVNAGPVPEGAGDEPRPALQPEKNQPAGAAKNGPKAGQNGKGPGGPGPGSGPDGGGAGHGGGGRP